MNYNKYDIRHCERSEAIQFSLPGLLRAIALAMTIYQMTISMNK